MSVSLSRGKRARSTEWERDDGQPPSKMSKTANGADQAIRCIAHVTFDEDYRFSHANRVMLGRSLYKTLFRVQKSGPCLIKVSNLVFKAFCSDIVDNDELTLTECQYQQVAASIFSKNDRDSIWISTFDKARESCAPLKEIVCEISSVGPIFDLLDEKASLLTASLETMIKKEWQGQILQTGQNLFFHHPVVGPLTVKIKQMTPAEVSEEKDFPLSLSSYPYYGEMASYTLVRCFSANPDRLVLVEEIKKDQLEKFHFSIISVTECAKKTLSTNSHSLASTAWKKGVSPLPLLLPFHDVVSKVKELLSSRPLRLGHMESLTEKEWQYKVKLTDVELTTPPQDHTDTATGKYKKNNVKAFYLDDDHKVDLDPGKQVILTTSVDNARKASKLTFKIVDCHRECPLQENELAWISVEEAVNQLRQQQALLAKNCQVVINLNGVRYLLKLIKADGPPCARKDENKKLSDIWKILPETDISLFSPLTLQLEVVDHALAQEIDFMKIIVSSPNDQKLFFFSENNEQKTVLDHKELREIFFESACKDGIVKEQQTITGLSAKGKEISFKLAKIQEKNPSENKKPAVFGKLFHLTKNTTIAFEGDKQSSIVVSSPSEEIDLSTLEKKLLEYGIGGMKEVFKKIICRTVLSRGSLREHAKDLNQTPSRGILLYGPPGTGKTMIARKIGQLLSIPEERTKLYSGPQFWNKWLGETERNIRQIFEDAREDQKRLGANSPLHLIVIDEGEAILSKRQEDQPRHQTSAVDTFISELDGISSQGKESLNNIIVVVLTNHPDSIDEAVKRPGRIFPHIHIGVPDAKGREEIFSIHTKRLIEKGLLAKDLDVKKIVDKTMGKTGAFIEGMVRVAVEYSMMRIIENKIPREEIPQADAAKIRMNDFLEAFKELSAKEGHKAPLSDFAPSLNISLDNIKQDLTKLHLAGFNDEVLKFLYDVKIAQHYKEFSHSINYPFPKGALLYGPPGVGKTRLAKSLQAFFGLDSERFTYYMASALWPDLGPSLKEKWMTILGPAKAAAKDLQGKAPLHIVVIDELDFLYARQSEQDTWGASVLNRFLMELEPLFEHELHNLLVIGIAHRNSLGLPESILRHGRLGKHIEVKLPSPEGRKEIFSLYLEKHRALEKLNAKVNLDDLVKKTEGGNGAYIEGLISQAISFSMRRVYRNDVDPAAALQSIHSDLTQKDFENALEELKKDSKWASYTL